jgi:ferric-dicitrate binding protein FerR (iron transport regulator)
MSHNECPNELDWSAFCYAAGELSPAEAEAFEQRLASDQAAREALARAVQLTQAVASAESLVPVVLRPASRDWGRRLAWMAIGSAASLLVAVLWMGGRNDTSTVIRQSPASQDQTALAAVWSQTRDELSTASDAELWYPAHLAASTGEQTEISTAADDDMWPAAPDWMTAAVVGDQVKPEDGDSIPFDRNGTEN